MSVIGGQSQDLRTSKYFILTRLFAPPNKVPSKLLSAAIYQKKMILFSSLWVLNVIKTFDCNDLIVPRLIFVIDAI